MLAWQDQTRARATEKYGSKIITKWKFDSNLLNSTNNNHYSALTTRDYYEITVTICHFSTPVETANKATNPIQISKDLGISDAGATGHFLQPGTPAKNIRPKHNPISISQPDGGKLESTHECEIDNPHLPHAARTAHIVPGLAHTSLESIKMLIDTGCNVTYNTKHVKVFYKGNMVWTGTRECLTGLWLLPLTQVGEISHPRTHSTDNHKANNAYQMISKEDLIRYLHQCLFCPPKSTLLKAIKITKWQHGQASQQNQFKDTSQIRAQRQIKVTWRGKKSIRSKKDKIKDALENIETARCMNPPEEKEMMNQIFMTLGYVDKKEGKIYADLTGKFPISLIHGIGCTILQDEHLCHAMY